MKRWSYRPFCTAQNCGHYQQHWRKKLDAAHHRWQRSILGISRKNTVTNAEVRTRTRQQSMDNLLRERRLRWLGLVLRMDHRRIPQQALYWEVPGFKRGPGRPRANWIGTVKKDLRKMTLTWEEAEVAALDRTEWRRSVAQCIHLDAGMRVESRSRSRSSNWARATRVFGTSLILHNTTEYVLGYIPNTRAPICGAYGLRYSHVTSSLVP